MVLLQYDYKGLRLYGKTRGLTHTDALYLEYIDGVRASPSVKRQSCSENFASAKSTVPRVPRRGAGRFWRATRNC